MSRRALVRRLLAMDRREAAARGAAFVRTAGQRIRARASAPSWRRRDLAARLAPLTPNLAAARDRVAAGEWDAAHAVLARHFVARVPRFVLHPAAREPLRARVLSTHPGAADRAHALAARVAGGRYDLLGYEGLRFGAEGTIDWHLDPVSGRRAPQVFWADVPYLDPSVGDHKVIWELNRHQEWLMLGRGWWLSGAEPAADHEFVRAFTDQLGGWLRSNPPGIGINWASSLELAFRSLSWLWALELFAASARPGGAPWTVDLLLGLDRQLRHSERHLSYYFSPNTHLLGEALALYVCGRALPELAAAPRWTRLGRRVLIEEARRQVLPDGAHAERSPHYHRYALDFYLLALAVSRMTGDRPTADRLAPVARGMAEFMRDVTDDTGRHPQIGDDDGGELAPVAGRTCGDARATLGWAAALLDRPELAIRPLPESVLWRTALMPGTSGDAARAPVPSTRRSASYPAAGYFVSRHAGSHLVFDAGPHGFLNAGHAHADALSLTLAAAGRPLLIDSGTGTYTIDAALRDHFRSSQAHNTVTVDGRSPSIPGGPFSWRSRADAAPGRAVHNPRFDYFAGISHAYAPLAHERRILSLDDGWWIVADLIDGEGLHDVALHWHVDPAWRAAVDGRGGVRLRHEDGAGAYLAIAGGPLEVLGPGDASGLGRVSPLYGRVEPATTIRSRVVRRAPVVLATVVGCGDPPHGPAARITDVLSERTGAAALAVTASDSGRTDVALFAGEATDVRTVIFDGRHGRSVTTDARMLYARVDGAGHLVRLALVDGSMARFEGACPVTVRALAPVRDVDVALSSGTPRVAASHRPDAERLHVEVGDPGPAVSSMAVAGRGRRL